MNIEELIKREAPEDNMHDRAYAEQLRNAYESYKDEPLKSLMEFQKLARALYARNMATHRDTARCIIIYELIKEKRNENLAL